MDHSQETWFLGSLFWVLLFNKSVQSKAKWGHLPGPYLETDTEIQILTKKANKAFGQWELFTSERM